MKKKQMRISTQYLYTFTVSKGLNVVFVQIFAKTEQDGIRKINKVISDVTRITLQDVREVFDVIELGSNQ